MRFDWDKVFEGKIVTDYHRIKNKWWAGFYHIEDGKLWFDTAKLPIGFPYRPVEWLYGDSEKEVRELAQIQLRKLK